MKENAINHALNNIAVIQNKIEIMLYIVYLITIFIGIFGLWKETQYLKAKNKNRERFIFKTSLSIGGYCILISILLILGTLGFNKTSFDLFLNIFTIILAGIAFMVAYLSFQRKNGVDIQGGFILPKGINKNSDTQTVELLLLNLKDKAETVFAIYIEDSIGENYLIYNIGVDNPAFILEPFKLLKIEIDKHIRNTLVLVDTKSDSSIAKKPPKERDLYWYLTKKMKRKFKIILSTSNGKYIIPKHIHYWHPYEKYTVLYNRDGTAPFLIKSEL